MPKKVIAKDAIIEMMGKVTVGDLVKATLQRWPVKHPEDIRVSLIESTKNFIVEITTADEDAGRVIGKKGANIVPLRKVISLMTPKGKRLDVHLTNPKPTKTK